MTATCGLLLAIYKYTYTASTNSLPAAFSSQLRRWHHNFIPEGDFHGTETLSVDHRAELS
jgi:hypothetical protein